MDTNREMEEVLLSIRKAMMFMDPVMKLMGVGTIMLLTQFARMRKEGRLSKHEFKNFQEFAKLSEGKYSIINIPVEKNGITGQDAFAEELKELDQQEIRYCVLPDLNENDRFIQLAILDQDKEKFNAWNERYLLKSMSGGEHELESLDMFTNGHTSLISLPLEGKEYIFQEDFQVMGINYASLPDLRVGDGQIQLVVANNDMQKVEHWFKMYQEDCLKQREDVPNLNQIDMETYKKTADLTPEEYINTAGDEIKEINRKYEGKSGELEQTLLAQDAILKDVQTITYADFERDQSYQKFTINNDTLVKPVMDTRVGRAFAESLDEKELFISRIPGTDKENTNYLIVPKEQVFVSNDKKTYTVFLEKAGKPIVMDKHFDIISSEKRKYAEELFKSNYDLSAKARETTKSIRNIGKNQVKMKASAVPMKVK